MSSGSNFLNGASCQLIGPSLSPSSAMPLFTNQSTVSPASASFDLFTTARWPFTAKTKSSGVSSRHLAKLSADCVR